MKKILLSAVALMSITAVQAQEEVPYIFSEVEDNVYAITMSAADIEANYPEEWCELAWHIGAAFPAGTVMFENDELTITAGTDPTPVYNQNNRYNDMVAAFPTYTAYVNSGSTLADKAWTGNEEFYFIADLKANNQGIVVVTPKVDGTLKFGVFAGDNSRAIGIAQEPTMEEIEMGEPGKWIAYKNFRNDGGEADLSAEPVEYERGEKNAPAYVEGAVTAGRNYGLVGGGAKNLTLHQITFVPGEGTGINNVVTDTTAAPADGKIYTIDGRYAGTDKAALDKGLYIQNGKKFIVK